jgi:predicted phage terminase large subunit-like protein
MARTGSTVDCRQLPRARVAQIVGMFAAELARQHGQARRAARQSQAAMDLLGWGQHYLPEHFSRPPSAMHRWMAEQFAAMWAGRGIKVNVLGPRGGAKSTIATLAYAMRCALEGRERYIWLVSDTRHQACAHLENIKSELLGNPRLAADYPNAAGRGPVWRSGTIVLRNGVMIQALGTGQRIRGRRHGAHRPTLIICDDLQNDGHILSARQRQRSRNWFHSALMKAGTARTNVVNLATALHRDALAMELHRTPGWVSRVFRAVVRWPVRMDLWEQWQTIYCDQANPRRQQDARRFYEENKPEMDAGAVLLWPEEEDLYTLMCMRAESGATAFEREKQNSPINPDQCEWPEEYFDGPIWFDDWPQSLAVKTMALDPSKGAQSRQGDYSAVVMLGVDNQGTLYAQAEMARRPTPQIVAQAVELFQRFRPHLFGVEANQFQELLAGQFEVEFRRQGVLAAKVWPIENHVNKQVRIRRIGPYLAARRILFRRNSPGTSMLVEQLRQFPLADHDDGPDALEMAIRLAVAMFQGRRAVDGLGDRLPVG